MIIHGEKQKMDFEFPYYIIIIIYFLGSFGIAEPSATTRAIRGDPSHSKRPTYITTE